VRTGSRERRASEETIVARVLVVDDDVGLRRMVSRVLIDAGHQVTEAEDGVSGLRRFHAENPDIVIVDIVMPEKDGIQTIQEIKRIGSTAGLIAISGGGVGDGALYLTIAKELGADVALQKPFRQEELVTAVDRVLAGAADRRTA
jgi:DNA-binding response OmpR family regulator